MWDFDICDQFVGGSDPDRGKTRTTKTVAVVVVMVMVVVVVVVVTDDDDGVDDDSSDDLSIRAYSGAQLVGRARA